jgi:hypothetical protein
MDSDLFRDTQRHDMGKASKSFSFRGWTAHMLATAFSAHLYSLAHPLTQRRLS